MGILLTSKINFRLSTRPLCLNCSLPAAHRSLACAGKETPAAKRRSDCRPASSNNLSPVGFCLMTFPPTPSSHPPTSPSHPPSSLAGKDCQPSQHKRSFAHEAIPTEPDLQMPLHKSPPPTHTSHAITGGDKPAATSINNRLSQSPHPPNLKPPEQEATIRLPTRPLSHPGTLGRRQCRQEHAMRVCTSRLLPSSYVHTLAANDTQTATSKPCLAARCK